MNQFDKAGSAWDRPRRLERAKVFASAIREALPPTIDGVRGLEYGCGTGALGLELQDQFRSLLLVDSSAGMIEQVETKLEELNGPKVSALQWDLAERPLPDTEVDVVFSTLAFHHIHDLQAVLENIRGLLPVGGRLLAIDMDQDGGFWHQNFEGFNGHHGFDRDELSKWCREARFRVHSVETVYSQTKTVDDETRQIPLFLLKAEAI